MTQATIKSHRTRNIVIVAIVIIVVAGIGLGGRMAPTERQTTVVKGVITVSPGSSGYQAYPFNAPSGATNIHLKGSFTASGGSGNDIIVLIMDETAFINWKNRHGVKVYYNSGKLTTSSFDVRLSAGSYYLVLDNTFSVISSKNVNIQADLIYTI